MHDIDVHVVASDEERARPWFSECMQSLAEEPINLHVIDRAGTVGESRAAGFSIGDAPFVSYVDPDDYVNPGIFEKALNSLSSVATTAVVTHEMLIDERGGQSSKAIRVSLRHKQHMLAQMHHLVVWRRDAVMESLGDMTKVRGVDPTRLASARALAKGNVEIIPEIGYFWRQHEGQAHRKDRVNEETLDLMRSYMEPLK